MAQPKVIIVGAGAAGIAAACRLLENQFNNFLILEAENRIGGRVNSVEFEGAHLDLGAQWCHGQKGNIVYEMVKDLDLITSSGEDYSEFCFIDSSGRIVDEDVGKKYVELHKIIADDNKAMIQHSGSYSDYYSNRFREAVLNGFDDSGIHFDRAESEMMLEWFGKMETHYSGATDWSDISTKGLTEYVNCEGDLLLNWKKTGYRTIFDVLTKKIPKSSTPLPIDDKIFFNKEVIRIVWDDNGLVVTVECKDGSFFNCDHVVVTTSLGVLKERYHSMFSPSLPEIKSNAIEGLGIGTVNKLILKFPKRWWSQDSGFSFLWSPEDTEMVTKEYPNGPKLNGKWWVQSIFGFYPVDSHDDVLLGWAPGVMAAKIEELRDEEILEGCMYLLKKFLGSRYDIPQAEKILCSRWYTNPNFRGSYSYRSLSSDRLQTSAADLARPVVSKAGKQVLLFAGEATNSCHYSTVHGAIETGFREADRLLNIYKMSEKCRVLIVGAGLAGLAAATELLRNGFDDFLIAEAQSHPGGRVHTVHSDTSTFDLGAQWIHCRGNPLYYYANEHNLLSPKSSREGEGIYVRSDGTVFDSLLVKKVDFVIGQILEKCEDFPNEEKCPNSIGEFLREEFTKYLNDCRDTENVRMMKEELFNWHVRFQVIDNSCLSLYNVSAKSWDTYKLIEDNGQDHINLTEGFGSVIDTLCREIPKDKLKLNCEVIKIKWKHKASQAYCRNGNIISADLVIVTSSLGVLKSCHSEMFDPPLPKKLTRAIQDVGFFGICKIFLEFDYKWWEDVDGFQIIWKLDANVEDGAEWTKHLTGFDLVVDQPNVLLGWVGGEGVPQVEETPKETVGKQCVELLRRFTGKEDIPYPCKVARSTWSSNPWIRGGYSHVSTRCDRSGAAPNDLAEPVTVGDKIRILLAGEACHPSHYSTTHGAFESGQMQALCALNHLENK